MVARSAVDLEHGDHDDGGGLALESLLLDEHGDPADFLIEVDHVPDGEPHAFLMAGRRSNRAVYLEDRIESR